MTGIEALRKRIKSGKATLADSAEYARLLAQLSGRELAAEVLTLDDRELAATSLLRENYSKVNAAAAEAQKAVDSKNGIGLNAVQADFPAERVRQFAHSLTDPTVPDETIVRRARAGAENITMSFHDDFIRENADFRDRAGLKCYVERITSGNCCQWCTDIAGKYEMKDQPQGLFGRHDNCDCVIIYDGQVLRGQMGENGRRGRKWVEEKDRAARIEYAAAAKPVRNTPEQAAALERKLLDNSRNSDIINTVNSSLDFMGTAHRETLARETVNRGGEKVLEEWSFKIYQLGGYPNIWAETYSENAQAMAEYLNEKVNNGKYGELDRIVIVKNSSLKGISSYDHTNNTFYISEELINQGGFDSIVDKSYFPARNIDDVITHELGGHKRHWDFAKEYYNDNLDRYSSLMEAKQNYERPFRAYIVKQQSSDFFYVKKNISENAFIGLEKSGQINEVIADCEVLYQKGWISDSELKKQYEEMMKYDGKSK